MVGKTGGKLKLSVLYAEDEAVTRTVFCEVLATKVQTVYQAANGREGLSLFIKHRPDAVIIDNNMPEMDGMALAREVKSIAPATPIIIVSGGMKKRTLVQVEQMEICYLKKPLRIRELIAFLETVADEVASGTSAVKALARQVSSDSTGAAASMAPVQLATT